MTSIRVDELVGLCEQALLRSGANQQSARALAAATVEAEQVGNRAVGIQHLFDYLDGYSQGRIARNAEPVIHRPTRSVFDVDASEGLVQTAFDAVKEDLLAATRETGIATLWIRNAYTCGELGFYPRQLAQQGLVAVAAANSPALMSIGGSPSRILGTNPLAYAIPREGAFPLVIDQASSSTAYVNIRRAAESGEQIPSGWALDADGNHTQDAEEALNGTLLPFGSHRGGNVALLIEILATLSGASFSLDAAPFEKGTESPGIGVFVLCIDPTNFNGSVQRLGTHFGLLTEEHGVRLPALELTGLPEEVEIDDAQLQKLSISAQ